MKLRTVMIAAALALTATGAPLAADEPQAVRQELMKEVGEATGTLAKMVKGELAYEQAAAIDALETINANVQEFVGYFPEGSQSGFETEADPAIWENKDAFEAKAQDLVESTRSAIEAAPQDMEALRGVFGPVGQDCQSCHEDFRVKSS